MALERDRGGECPTAVHEGAPSGGATRTPVGAMPAPAAASERLVYVDRLRVLAVVGVFVIHVCEVFNPWDEWHITNAERSRVAGELVVLLAPWIMPLFMLLAGVSAWYSLDRRSNCAYLRERAWRTLVPLVVGTLALVPPQVYLERRWRGQFDGSFVQFLPHFFDGIYPRGNLSWHHLWFLAHLFVYSLVALPLFRWWRTPRGHAQLRRVARLCSGPGGLLWLALPLVVERTLLWGLLPERLMLTSDWSNHALLFVAYLYGFVLAGEPWLGARVDAEWPPALASALVVSTLLVVGTLGGVIPGLIPPPFSPRYVAFWSLYAVGAWSWMVAVLGAGRRWLRREPAALRYGRANGYGWYLVHQPVIIAAAYLIVPMRVGVGVKLVAILALSIAGTLLGAELVRRTPLARRLLGVRSAAA